MAQENIVLGMAAIRECGLKAYSNNYYWPISDEEFCGFVDRIIGKFDEKLVDCERVIFDVVLSDYRFLILLLQHLHYRLSINRLGFSEHPPKTGDPGLDEILTPDWQKLSVEFSQANVESNLYSQTGSQTLHFIKDRIRKILKTIYYNGSTLDLGSLFKHNELASIGPIIDFKRAILRGSDSPISILEWHNFIDLRQRHSGSNDTREFSRRVVTKFLKPFLDDIRKECVQLGIDLAFSSICKTWSRRLDDLFEYHTFFRKFSNKPSMLLVTGAGNPLRKALSTALQSEGTEVFVLHHGECAGVEKYPNAHRNDGSFARNFLCPTSAIARNFRSNYADSRLEKKADVTYRSIDSDHYPRLRQKYRSTSGKRRREFNNKEVVMLIGYGMNHMRYLDGAGYFFYFQLDVQFRLAQLIRNSGYYLIYKVHPDRAQEVGSLFGPYVDKCEVRPFEEVWDSAHKYVFSHPGSTVFGGAIMTKKPMVLIDIENNNWRKEGYDSLKKRVQMIPARYNDENRIEFNEEQFVLGLENDLPLSDKYVEQYF